MVAAMAAPGLERHLFMDQAAALVVMLALAEMAAAAVAVAQPVLVGLVAVARRDKMLFLTVAAVVVLACLDKEPMAQPKEAAALAADRALPLMALLEIMVVARAATLRDMARQRVALSA